MTALPNIPRLYTALAECMAILLYAWPLPRRFGKRPTIVLTGGMGRGPEYIPARDRRRAAGLVDPLHGGGHRALVSVPVGQPGYPLAGSRLCLRPGIYSGGTGRQRGVAAPLRAVPAPGGGDGLALLLLVVVDGVLYGTVFWLERRRPSPTGKLTVSNKAALVAVVMAAMVFAVSNLLFLDDGEVNMSIYYIRTLVDFCGVLILTIQHDQLRESALHSELEAMDEVLHRQYEQYKRSKEGIKLINSRYHELKIQIANIRAERDQAKQDAALARMESGIRQYEAENKTGNPVLDTLLTAKSMECQEQGINMTSVADGQWLGFLSTREICTLAGVPLDNAVESLTAEPDPEKRLLRVAIYAQSGCVMLRFENYCAAPVALGPDGLPVRSAHGGYDLRGVQAAARQHGGTMTVKWENSWFTVRILLPIPEKE